MDVLPHRLVLSDRAYEDTSLTAEAVVASILHAVPQPTDVTPRQHVQHSHQHIQHGQQMVAGGWGQYPAGFPPYGQSRPMS
jgi:hypothetical protein